MSKYVLDLDLDAQIAHAAAIHQSVLALPGNAEALKNALLALRNSAQPISVSQAATVLDNAISTDQPHEWATSATMTNSHVVRFLDAVPWADPAERAEMDTLAMSMQAAINDIIARAQARLGG